MRAFGNEFDVTRIWRPYLPTQVHDGVEHPINGIDEPGRSGKSLLKFGKVRHLFVQRDATDRIALLLEQSFDGLLVRKLSVDAGEGLPQLGDNLAVPLGESL